MQSVRFRRLSVVFLSGMLFLYVFIAWRSRDLIQKGYPDFTIFYSAGRIVAQGLGQHLYDPKTQYRIQQQFAAGVSIRKGPLPYNHPPFEAIAFVPFSFLPYATAYLLWDSFSLLLLLVVLRLLRRTFPGLRESSIWYWALVCAASFPVFVALLQGQDVIVLLLMVTLSFLSLKKGSDFASGAWLGLGLFRFHVVFPILLLLVLKKRGKAVLGFGAIAVALGLVSLSLVGWKGVLHYPAYVWHVEHGLARGAIVSSDMPSIRGFLDAVFGVKLPGVVMVLLAVLSSIVLLVWVATLWKTSATESEFDLGYSLCLMMAILVSYHSFIYDQCLLLLPLLILGSHIRMPQRYLGWTEFSLLAPVAILLLTPIPIFFTLRLQRAGLLVPALFLWMWGIARLLVRTRLTRSSMPLKE